MVSSVDSFKRMQSVEKTSYLYSGHESFSLRISWIPKGAAALAKGLDPFSDPRKGMTLLGLGKNMVQSLQFWLLATGVACRGEQGLQLTDLGLLLFKDARPKGYDPYLENTQTLWLLHWGLCQGWRDVNNHRLPYAWYFFSNLLIQDEISPSEAVDHYASGPVSSGKALSHTTLKQHFEVFVRTYVDGDSASSRSTPEDALDSPLSSLSLIKLFGERKLPNGKREPVYRINMREKESLSDATFRLCIHEWWNKHFAEESVVTVRDVAHTGGSPGRCFFLPEYGVFKRLERLSKLFPKEFKLSESRNQRAIQRKSIPNLDKLVATIYKT